MRVPRNIDPSRMRSFSDNVISIILTIMVLNLVVPHTADARALLALWPTFLCYFVSYLLVAIYWMNHHYLLMDARRVSIIALWRNVHWLFCLSLIPFATAYAGETHLARFPTALYAGTLLLAGVAFVQLRRAVFACDPARAEIGHRSDLKSYAALAIYAAGVPLAFVGPAITIALALTVTGIFVLPDAWLGRPSPPNEEAR